MNVKLKVWLTYFRSIKILRSYNEENDTLFVHKVFDKVKKRQFRSSDYDEDEYYDDGEYHNDHGSILDLEVSIIMVVGSVYMFLPLRQMHAGLSKCIQLQSYENAVYFVYEVN